MVRSGYILYIVQCEVYGELDDAQLDTTLLNIYFIKLTD